LTARAALGWLIALAVLAAGYLSAIAAVGWLALGGLIVVVIVGTAVVLAAVGFTPDDLR
jgi:hypothetical protein